jgi:hypothetical protein
LRNLIFNHFDLVLIVLINQILRIRNHIVQVLLKALIEFSANQAEFAKLGFHVEVFDHIRKYARTNFQKWL